MKKTEIIVGFLFLILILFLPVTGWAQGIEIESGGSIVVTGAAKIEIDSGDFINNGSYTRDAETLIFSGDQPQTISGNNTDFYNLIIENTGGISSQLNELTANDLTIEAGGKITIVAGKAINIEGDLSNSAGTFIVNSDVTGAGSLIVAGSSTGDVNYNSFLTANQWHVVSAPVSTQSINSFLLNGSNSIPSNPSSQYALTDYNETNGRWSSYFTTATAGNFLAGKGYLMRRNISDGTVSYTGNLVDTDHTYDISGVDRGWNAVGNPFTSAIGITAQATSSTESFLTINANSLDPSYTAIFCWNEAAGYDGTQNNYYVICNSGYNATLNYPRELDRDYLQAGQGFLVKSKSGGSTLSFNKAMQTHQVSESLLKSAKVSWDGLSLVARRGEDIASTIVTFNEGMTEGLDPSFDVGLLSSNPEFSLYSRLLGDDEGIDFTIQSLPAVEAKDFIVPIGLDLTTGGELSFSTLGVYLPGFISIALEDRELGIFTDLTNREADYTVWLGDEISGIGRFFLHIGNSTTQTFNNEDKNNLIAYYHSQHIQITGNVSEGSFARLVDLHGRVVSIYRLEPGRNNSIPVSEITNGIYVLVIIDGTYQKTTKLLIN